MAPASMPLLPDGLVLLVAKMVQSPIFYNARAGDSSALPLTLDGRGWLTQIRGRRLYVAWLDGVLTMPAADAVATLRAQLAAATPLDLDHDLSPAQRDVLERATLTRDNTDAALFFGLRRNAS